VLAIIPLGLVLYYVMPDHWFERMETIETWEEDESASERVRAWQNAILLANERFIGGGMRAMVIWGPEGGRDTHSIYFGMLGEHGWVGLGMFLLLIAFTWSSGNWIIRNAKRHKDLYWARDLAAMIQVSLIGYMSAGAFLGLQYFDLFYHLVAIIVVTKVFVAQQIAEKDAEAAAERLSTGRGFVQGKPSPATTPPSEPSRSPWGGAGKPVTTQPKVRSFVRGE
jgi:probable O-glycosylation ligase (exosortase A-associated)